MFCESYYTAKSLDEALEFLRQNAGEARVIAGGTDLVIQMKKKEKSAKALVYLTRIKELRYIREDGDLIRIGALSTHNDMATSGLIIEKAKALALAAQAVGSPQIRRVGTVGGNIVNAQPAADAAIALMALGAKVKVVSAEGERVHDLADLYAGVGSSTIDPGKEILTEFFFPIPGGSGFRRLARREVLALPILNVAAAMTFGDRSLRAPRRHGSSARCRAPFHSCICQDVRLAIGPVATMPFRAVKAEAVLRGETVTAERISQAAEAAMAESNPRDSRRGRAQYRREMIRVLAERALQDCLGPQSQN